MRKLWTKEVGEMISILTISASLVALYILFKYMYFGGRVSFKNNYISKGFIVSFVVNLALYIVLFIIWMRLLAFMLSPSVSRMMDSNFSDDKASSPIGIFIALMFILLIFVTFSLMNRILKYSYYTFITVVRLRNQQKNTIANIFLKAIHHESDEVIVEKYKTMDKAPLLPYEEPRLTQSEEMKLVSALLNMGEYDEATQLSKKYVRSNMKLVKNKITLKPLSKTKVSKRF